MKDRTQSAVVVAACAALVAGGVGATAAYGRPHKKHVALAPTVKVYRMPQGGADRAHFRLVFHGLKRGAYLASYSLLADATAPVTCAVSQVGKTDLVPDLMFAGGTPIGGHVSLDASGVVSTKHHRTLVLSCDSADGSTFGFFPDSSRVNFLPIHGGSYKRAGNQ
ncbi:MAG TPA: hypothetical protein VF426_00445 [Marmoricola sp.]